MKLAPLLTLFAAISTTATCSSAQVEIDKHRIVSETVEGEHDCAKRDWQFAQLAVSSGLLKHESLPTHTCRAISLAWLPSAKIVQVTGWQHQDIFVSCTVVRARDTSPLRLITALGGLVINKDHENDEANRAAFNELMQIAAYKPKDDQIIELGVLYLFLVGHPPDETKKNLGDVIMVNDMLGSGDSDKHETKVTVRQRFSPLGNSHKDWTLLFRSEENYLKLVSVTPEHP